MHLISSDSKQEEGHHQEQGLHHKRQEAAEQKHQAAQTEQGQELLKEELRRVELIAGYFNSEWGPLVLGSYTIKSFIAF